jgi:hypothetical protein
MAPSVYSQMVTVQGGGIEPEGFTPLAGGKAVRPPPPDEGNNRIDPGRGRSLQSGSDPLGSDGFALLTGG